jgi:hypothetical protein
LIDIEQVDDMNDERDRGVVTAFVLAMVAALLRRELRRPIMQKMPHELGRNK